MVEWLSTHKHTLDVAAVNAELETGIHCAARSNSPATMQVISMYVIYSQATRHSVSCCMLLSTCCIARGTRRAALCTVAMPAS